jgi:2-furoyl-CoA dehydrogenase 2Fe-2S iron sulfur subunit
MKQRVTITLNGRKVSGEAEPRMLLSDFLRHELGATGTHVGCEHGVCGCCTVIIDGVAGRSCLAFAVQANGAVIETVESLAPDDMTLNDLQDAFNRYHALQCGFCTAGILMSFTNYLARNPKPSREEVTEVLGGHICRCTGYANIIDAVMDVVERRQAPAGAA